MADPTLNQLLHANDTLTARISKQAREIADLRAVIETALAYEGPRASNEMTMREKLAFLYRGDINWRPKK